MREKVQVWCAPLLGNYDRPSLGLRDKKIWRKDLADDRYSHSLTREGIKARGEKGTAL